ncbi:MAG: hypothetical protein H7039_09320 [Bryobacteraceae bacterium]|nr:hypothetical protein [Bryobacteraceae bacterium]
MPTVSAAISAISDPSIRRVAPGSLMTVFGANFARVITDVGSSFDGVNAPASFNGVSVRIGDLVAPIVTLGDGYVVVQVPFETTPGTRRVTVRTAAGESTPVEVEVAATAPAIYFDTQAGIFTNLSYMLTGRPGAAAEKGQYIIVFTTGLAPLAPIPTGQYFTTGANAAPVTATIDNRPATVFAAVTSPGFIGLYQVYVLVPAETASGTVPLQLRSGGAASNTVNLVVR